MKKTFWSLVALMLMAAPIMTSCSDDNDEVVPVEPVVTPAVENPFSWTVGSAIALMDGTNHSKYNYVSGDGNTLSSFALADGQTAVSGANIYALYPYAVCTTSELRIPTQAEAEAAAGSCSRYLEYWKEVYPRDSEYILESATHDLNGAGVSEENQTIVLAYIKDESTTMINRGVELDGSSIKNVVIPAEQTAIADAVDPQAAVKVAKADGKNLVFADVCAYVKVTPQFDCCAIALTSKGDELLAGKVDINYNNGAPTTTVTADGANTIYLVGTITAGNSYYIAVRPETLASGYTIEFLTADKGTYYAQSPGNAFELERGSVNDLGKFTASSSWTIFSATSGNDGAGHNWMLVTPTLKINTPASFEHVPFADITPWEGWELPTADELFEAWINGAFTNNNYVSYTFRGIGILKYGKSVEVSGTIYNYIWTSTPVADNEERQHTIMVNMNQIGWVTKSPTQEACVLRKYNN